MTTKEELLELLAHNAGVYYSGEAIAKLLGVSRAAVWKAVKALRSDGYTIDAVTNKGYCLLQSMDIMSAQGIAKYLTSACDGLVITVLPSVSSTNALVREKAEGGAPAGYTLLANEQCSGRGRRGRSFFSPAGTGIYMSLLLRPQQYSTEQAVRITSIAAVAMCEAIEAVTAEKAMIKWVNDIFVRGKKVCGILTEAAFDLENSLLSYAVLGAGINVYEPTSGFPEEIREVAGALFRDIQQDIKNRLAAAFLNRFMAYYSVLDTADYVEQYRERSFVIGKTVTVIAAGHKDNALVLGIDDACRLLVRYDDGREAALSSGEISIRLAAQEK